MIKLLKETLVSDVMTKNPVVITPRTTIVEAATLMKQLGVSALPVVDVDEKLIGIITERDMVWKVIAERRPPDTPVNEIMTRTLIVIRESDTVEQALQLMNRFNVRHLPVVDEAGRLKGILSLRDIEYILI